MGLASRSQLAPLDIKNLVIIIIYLPAAAAAGLEVGRANAGKPPSGAGVADGTLAADEPGALAGAGEGPAGTMTTSMAGASASTTEISSSVAGAGAETGGKVAAVEAEALAAPRGAADTSVTFVASTGNAATVTLLADAALGAAAFGVVTLERVPVSLRAGAVAEFVALAGLILVAGTAGDTVTLLVGGAATTVTLPAGAVAGPAAIAGLAVVLSADGSTVLVRLLSGAVGGCGIVMLPTPRDRVTVPLPAGACIRVVVMSAVPVTNGLTEEAMTVPLLITGDTVLVALLAAALGGAATVTVLGVFAGIGDDGMAVTFLAGAVPGVSTVTVPGVPLGIGEEATTVTLPAGALSGTVPLPALLLAAAKAGDAVTILLLSDGDAVLVMLLAGALAAVLTVTELTVWAGIGEEGMTVRFPMGSPEEFSSVTVPRTPAGMGEDAATGTAPAPDLAAPASVVPFEATRGPKVAGAGSVPAGTFLVTLNAAAGAGAGAAAATVLAGAFPEPAAGLVFAVGDNAPGLLITAGAASGAGITKVVRFLDAGTGTETVSFRGVPATVVVSDMLAVTGAGREGTVTVRGPRVDVAGCPIVGGPGVSSDESAPSDELASDDGVTPGKSCSTSNAGVSNMCVHI